MPKITVKDLRNTPEYIAKSAWAKAFVLSTIEKKIEQEKIIRQGKGVLKKHFDELDFEIEEIWDGVCGDIAANDILKMSKKELKQLAYDYHKTEKDSWLIHENAKTETIHDIDPTQNIDPAILVETKPAIHFVNEHSHASLDNLFFDKKEVNNCLKALSQTKPRIVDDRMNFVLSSRNKSPIAVWIKVLKSKNKIKAIDDRQLVHLLNNKINNLNMGFDGKTLRAISQTALNKFEKQLTDLIA